MNKLISNVGYHADNVVTNDKQFSECNFYLLQTLTTQAENLGNKIKIHGKTTLGENKSTQYFGSRYEH